MSSRSGRVRELMRLIEIARIGCIVSWTPGNGCDVNVNRCRWIMLTYALLLIGACDSGDVPVEKGSEFALKALADKELVFSDVLGESVSDLEVDTHPLIAKSDIVRYDFSTHCIYLQRDKVNLLPLYNREGPFFQNRWCDRPFVVSTNGDNRFLGYFQCGLFYNANPVPSISDLENHLYPSDVLCIDWDLHFSEQADTRYDTALRSDLIEMSLYSAGLEVELVSASLDTNGDTTAVSYSYVLTNLGEDDLLVLDPDIMGEDLFHYFNAGPVLQHLASGDIYRADNRPDVDLPSPLYWEPNWFTSIPAGEKKKWNVSLGGYPKLPPGTYRYQTRFDNPKNISISERYADGARYWIGSVSSRTHILQIEYE